jgi:hypothetical protein
MGTYCVAPLDPCPSVEDGVCDDPTGNGSCAAGTDNRDCQCVARLPDSTCDPVSQCGCTSGSTCFASLVEGSLVKWHAECAQAGTAGVGGTCSSQSACGPGLFCDGLTNTCAKYCGSDTDCGSGACNFITDQSGAVFGHCRDACKAGDDSSCPKGNVCAAVDAKRTLFTGGGLFKKSGNFCWAPASGKLCVTDGVCDDPTGTKLCTAGADDKDCCKPPDEGRVQSVSTLRLQ